jgi:hypothetical protein
MLSGPNAHESDTSPSFTGSLYFRVRDVESLWAQLKDKVRVCYPLEDDLATPDSRVKERVCNYLPVTKG